jgi:hypothetical protein
LILGCRWHTYVEGIARGISAHEDKLVDEIIKGVSVHNHGIKTGSDTTIKLGMGRGIINSTLGLH